MNRQIIFIATLFFSLSLNARTLIYIEQTGKVQEKKIIHISEEASSTTFQGHSTNNRYTYSHGADHNGLSYYKSEDGKVLEVMRKGNRLTATYCENKQSFVLDGAKWRQFLYLAEDFTGSSRKTELFWIVSDSIQESKDEEATLKCVQFILKKDGSEKISINGKSMETERVIMTFPDYRSTFWKAVLWYDRSGLLVRSKMKQGGPWTPYTVRNLVSDID